MTGPLVVEVVRGPVVESRHEVIAVVVDRAGSTILSHGDPSLVVPPRSAVKPLQALPLVASGAADAFELSDADLALACASHSGEPGHVAGVESILDRLDLAEDDLECGPSLPLGTTAAHALLASGGNARRLTHTCSGKHAGFLTLARHRGVPTAGYLAPDHAVQQEVLGSIALACEIPVEALGVDGCGAPVLSMPLRDLAAGFATLVDPDSVHAAPAERLRRAMAAEPWFVAGTDRLDTRLGIEFGNDGFVKTGAEGVYAGALAEPGYGIALKTIDGATRAAEVALVHVLVELGALEPRGAIADRVAPAVHNAAGELVGEIRVAPTGQPAANTRTSTAPTLPPVDAAMSNRTT